MRRKSNGIIPKLMNKLRVFTFGLLILSAPSVVFAADAPTSASLQQEKENMERNLRDSKAALKKKDELNNQLKKTIQEMESVKQQAGPKGIVSIAEESNKARERLAKIQEILTQRSDELEKARKLFETQKQAWEHARELQNQDLKEKQAAVQNIYKAVMKERQILDAEKTRLEQEKALLDQTQKLAQKSGESEKS